MSNLLADYVPHDKIRQYTNATDAEIAEAEEEICSFFCSFYEKKIFGYMF